MPRLWDLRLQWDCRISLFYAQWQYSIYPYICVFRKQALSNKHSSTYFNMRQNSRKRDVHSFHCVWQLYILTPPEQEKKTRSKQTSSAWKSPNTVKSSSKTCLLFGHLLYVVPWTGIIGNLWRYTLLQTCHDTLTKTGSLNPNSRFTKQNYSSHLYNTGKSVQTVSNCNVNSLPKYSVPPLRVGNDLHKWTATQRRENPERVKRLFRLR